MKTDVDLSQLVLDRGGDAQRDSLRPPRRRWMTRYVLPGVVIFGTLALLVWAGRDQLFPPRSVVVVSVLATEAEIQQEGTPLFKAAGWIEPRPTPVRVAALAPGVVEQLLVVEGQDVKAGEPIAELVDEDAQLACQGAEADLKLREAELRSAGATLAAAETRYEQPAHLQAALAAAEAELAAVETQLAGLPFEQRRAEADLAYARSSYEGKSSAGEAVTGRLLQEARSRYHSAEALVEELHRRAQSLQRHNDALARRSAALAMALELRADEQQARDEARAAVAVAQARVQQAQVAIAQTKLQLDRMTVRSTVDGRVLHLVAQPGTRLAGGASAEEAHDGSTVVTLYRPEMLQVRVDVRFEDLPRIQLGQAVAISTPAISSPLTGEVLFLNSEADIQKNTLEVKVAIIDPPPVLKPEMLVEVTFLAPRSQQENATPSENLRLLIPNQLVQHDGGQTFVWIADQSAGRARRTPIELGHLTKQGLVEVTRGLNAASRIIASDEDNLEDGERIRVTGDANEAVALVMEKK